MIKNFKVEAEHNELILQNSYGDYAIVPAKDRVKLQHLIDTDCHDCIDHFVDSLPKMSNYAENGTVIADVPYEAPRVEPLVADLVKAPGESDLDINSNTYTNTPFTPDQNYEVGKNHNKFIFTDKQFYEKDYTKYHKKADGGCTAGAGICLNEEVMPWLPKEIKSFRTQIANLEQSGWRIKDSDYSIPSDWRMENGEFGKGYRHNAGVDAWEVRKVLMGELGATSYYERDGVDFTKGNRYPNGEYLPDSFDYSGITIGSVIHMGNSKNGSHTEDEYNTHTAVVTGFRNDGMPIIYDYSDARTLDASMLPINSITIPKGFEGLTFNDINSARDKYIEDLNYKEGVEEYELPYVNDIQSGMQSIEAELGVEYGIKSSLMGKLRGAVVGIAAKESNFNGEGGEELNAFRRLANWALDTKIGNEYIKPAVKAVDHANNTFMDYSMYGMEQLMGALLTDFSPEELDDGLSDFQLEVYVTRKNPDLYPGTPEWKQVYNDLRDFTPKPKAEYNTQSSYGPMKIKNLSEYSTDKLGLSIKDLYSYGTSKDHLVNSTKAALVYMVENYTELREENPKMTEEQLINLSITSYSNSTKKDSEDFKEFYIMNDTGLKDDYITKVNQFTKKYNR